MQAEKLKKEHHKKEPMKRRIPQSAKMSLLINGNYGLIALLIFFIGMVMGLNFLSTLDFDEFVYLRGETEVGKGEVLDVFETNTSIDDVSIYGYDYVFHSPTQDFYWTSYRVGFRYDVGDKVDIEYSSERPYVNRIKGMTNNAGSGWFASIPTVIGLIWIVVNYFIGARKVDIIAHGELTKGSLTAKEATSMSINDSTVYRLTYQFKAKEGQSYQITTSTHEPEKLGNGGQFLVYDTRNPVNGLVLNNLPWSTGYTIRKNWN